MDQPTATLIAGVTAAVGSTAVGLTALFFAARNTSKTLNQQAAEADRGRAHDWRRAREQRLWDRRNDAYQALLEWLDGPGHAIGPWEIERGLEGDMFSVGPPAPGEAPSYPRQTVDPPAELVAVVEMFGSDEVVEKLRALQDCALRERRYEISLRFDVILRLQDDQPDVAAIADDNRERSRMTRVAREDWNVARGELWATVRAEYQNIDGASSGSEL
ncbi:hypothetical protein GON03_19080 [Nocardioides sp. MAH-18]|uniref:Uncharacterized protein n=1 Tax=Nocardioides agri TaxID=2682843 RepID=A0A6L6XVQ5_9ACTN|nr:MULTISPECIES: hypothetical protein [unclassified Nocardioides]MBA2952121.1 hypothetical protein [Nocardioides sp. CGMCC 1.13656]MVQ51290.1 hypothetical protein [Nocardioides sp. MAH-18]